MVEDKNMTEEKEEDKNPKKQIGHITETIRENPWILSTFVLGALVILLLFGSSGMTGGVITGSIVSETDAGKIILDLAKAQVGDAEVIEVNEKSGLYEVVLSLNGQQVPVYVTLDGENLVQGLTPLAALIQQNPESTGETPSTVPKSDRPLAELFVMTHCPYGTQAEKGFIPVVKALQEVMDIKIRFVHYFMHEQPGQEPDETPIQVCIREEQKDKFLDYLECFLEDGNSARCILEVGVDEAKIQECISSGRADEYYDEDSVLSQNYGVQGSPTLIINGAKSSAGRDAASYLTGICGAFNTAPDECDLELSSSAPSPGFGYSASGSASSAAQCS